MRLCVNSHTWLPYLVVFICVLVCRHLLFFVFVCVYLTESYWPYSGAIPGLLLDKHMHTTPLFSLSLFDLYKSFSAWGLKHTPVQWPSMTAKAGPGALKRQSFWIVSSFPCKLNHFHNYWHSSPKKNENSLIIYSSSCHSKPVWLLWNIKTFWETSVFFSHTMKVSNHQNCLLNLCSAKERKRYRFGKMWIFHFGWTGTSSPLGEF